MAFIAHGASADQLQADWDIQGLTHNNLVFTNLSLDLDLMPRYIDAVGIIRHTNNLLFRPIDGTCVVELTGNIVCALRLDALSLIISLNQSAVGTIELIDTRTTFSVGFGAIVLTSLK